METIKRILEDRIVEWITPGKAILIFGARRVGKTILMRKLVDNYPGRAMMLNGEDFDTLALLENRTIANYRHLLEGVELLAIDEAQNIPYIGNILKLIVDEVGGYIDAELNERLLGILSTKENVNLETLGFGDESKKYRAIITPIDIAGERLGTLFEYRCETEYDIDDIILTEYGTTVVGLEMMRSVNEESAEEARKIAIVKSAISTLSFSELEAITHIFDELDGNEGILVASRIADRVGITRSVIVNALRKFESAGVIESRSSGMKGTYIKVVNDVVFDELAELKRKNAK